jgi:hypothetical protein
MAWPPVAHPLPVARPTPAALPPPSAAPAGPPTAAGQRTGSATQAIPSNSRLRASPRSDRTGRSRSWRTTP